MLTMTMAFRTSLSSKHTILGSLLRSLLSPPTTGTSCQMCSKPSQPSVPTLARSVTRVLSDHRNPHDDLELSLASFTPHISTNLVEHVLKRCKTLGFSAHRFFLWAKGIPGFEHSYESYRILVDVLGRSNQFAILWDLLIDVRDSGRFQIGSEIFRVVFRSYSRAGLPRDAIRAFNRMAEFRVKPTVDDLNSLLKALRNHKQVEHAHEFFEKSKAWLDPNAETYSVLMLGWGTIGEPEQARQLFDEMSHRGISLDVRVFNSYLESLCRGGNSDEAHEILREMAKTGPSPDVESYTVFLRAFCESDNIDGIFRVLAGMKRRNLSPDISGYNLVINKLCNHSKADEAYKLMKEMIENGVSPDSSTINAIISSHCKNFEVNRALKLLSATEKKWTDRDSYNMVLKLLIRFGRLDDMAEVWNRMSEKGFRGSVSTYSTLIHGFLMKGNRGTKMACKYLEEMVDRGIPPYLTTVQRLRDRLLRLGLPETIERIACKMELSTCHSVREMTYVMRARNTTTNYRKRDR